MHTHTLAQAVDSQSDDSRVIARHHTGRPTFSIACWLLAMLAFIELITVGTALTVRRGSSDKVAAPAIVVAPVVEVQIHPRSIEQILADAEQSSNYKSALSASSPPALRDAPTSLEVVGQLGTATSRDQGGSGVSRSLAMIADPKVERLVREARSLHLEGDMMRAMLKLDEASRIDPSECAVIYQQGILFEDMGIFTKAADQYQKIQQMGLVKSGQYFQLASDKLSAGMTTMSVMRDTIAIGPMKVNKGHGRDAGRHVEVAVTLLSRADKLINPNDVAVDVYFYDKVNGGQIKKSAQNAKIASYWADKKVDWADLGNEETFRVSYTIPDSNLAEEHLFGRREYYGYVVELLYKGEVIDQEACPRRLNSIHSKSRTPLYQDDLGGPWLPSDDNDLLPGKDDEYLGEEGLPSR